jgi:hypothetical protein
LIGNSLIEIYVPATKNRIAEDRIAGKNLKVRQHNPWEKPAFMHNLNTEAIVNRLAGLYNRAHLVKLREAILEGASEQQAALVMERVQMLQKNRNTGAAVKSVNEIFATSRIPNVTPESSSNLNAERTAVPPTSAMDSMMEEDTRYSDTEAVEETASDGTKTQFLI